ncbi:hypothetical protein [Actinoplanes flavus]|uniref:Uncharacterized protein n=1 Tax=Actinoplanes flavus TaxID=2820290 RepID=A0ABS3UD54_9ACTN|nr:hypothetical protein [Actinoplanes flavus]MBO3736707.1 hypothetical protein [Actinoplanes flavus]
MSAASEFRAGLRRLHAEKDTAYRTAWKRRGELLSVLPNIARKADRLESAGAGAPGTRDEDLMDTVVDLLVYTLKYQTLLGDQDPAVAAHLFDQLPPPYSDGRQGFEVLLDGLDLSPLDEPPFTASAAEATTEVLTAFQRVESCFTGNAVPAGERQRRAAELAAAVVRMLAVLRHKKPSLYQGFLDRWGGGDR